MLLSRIDKVSEQKYQSIFQRLELNNNNSVDLIDPIQSLTQQQNAHSFEEYVEYLPDRPYAWAPSKSQ